MLTPQQMNDRFADFVRENALTTSSLLEVIMLATREIASRGTVEDEFPIKVINAVLSVNDHHTVYTGD